MFPEGSEDGFGTLATPRGRLPLKALDVHARLDGLLAHRRAPDVRQRHDEPLEATYIFPLPDRAAVTRFRMEVAGRVVEGELQGARPGRAQRLRPGDRSRATGRPSPRRSGRASSPCASATCCPARRRRSSLTLTGPLPFDDGEVTFRFPLVVAPRYIPGMPLPGPTVGGGTAADTDAVPDASRIIAAGAAARLPEPGAAVADGRRCAPATAGRATSAPACTPSFDGGRPAAVTGVARAAGRAARPRLHPALPARATTASAPSLLARSPTPSTASEGTFAADAGAAGRRRRRRRGRATWCSCSTAPAAWRAGRWWRPGGPLARMVETLTRARPLHRLRLRRPRRDAAGLRRPRPGRRHRPATASARSSSWPRRRPRRHRDGRAARPGRRSS